MGGEIIEEALLLPRSTLVDDEAMPVRYVGDMDEATPVVVLSTMVALCGSLCSGSAVSAIANTHSSLFFGGQTYMTLTSILLF
jgi:hypothetical protein